MTQPLGTTHALFQRPAGLMHINTCTKKQHIMIVSNCRAGWHLL